MQNLDKGEIEVYSYVFKSCIVTKESDRRDVAAHSTFALPFIPEFKNRWFKRESELDNSLKVWIFVI